VVASGKAERGGELRQGKASGDMKMQMKRMKHVTWFDNFCICFKNDVHSGKDIASLFSYQSINLSNGKVKSLFFIQNNIILYIIIIIYNINVIFDYFDKSETAFDRLID
jgi:hypothetical protein